MSRRTIAIIVAAIVAVLALGLGAGRAYAYFTSSGSGSGQATASSGASPITIGTASVSGTTPLYPGGIGDLVATVTNPNQAPVTVTAATISSSTCTTAALTLKQPFTIPANKTSAVMDFAGVLSMGADASNDCQGKTLTLSLSNLTVQQ